MNKSCKNCKNFIYDIKHDFNTFGEGVAIKSCEVTGLEIEDENFLCDFWVNDGTYENKIMTLGEIIRYYRSLNNWTITKLAGKIDVSTTQMSAIEHGKKRPSFEVYIKIAKLFGLTLSDRAKIDDAYLISKHGEDYHIYRSMWESIFFNEKGML